MQRATVVYYCDAPSYGGAEYYLYLVASGLPRDRFDVRVIMRRGAALDPLRRPLREVGIEVFEPPEPAVPDPRHWASVYRYVRRVHAEILHVNLPGPYDGQRGSIPVVGKAAGVPVVTTEHLPMFRGGWGRRMSKRLSQAFVDVTVTVSDANVGCLVDIHGMPRTRIRRIYNGIDLEAYPLDGAPAEARARLGLEDGQRAVGIIGRLDSQKGHDVFLRAARGVYEQEPGTRFFIVGDGDLRKPLEAMADELGLTGAVRFLGYCTDVPLVLRGLDFVVLASIYEGMPFALLEAMAMARPVVATDVFGLREVIRDGATGRLVPPGDSDAIAKVLLELLRSPETARRLGLGAREAVAADFRQDRMLRETADVYESLLSGRVRDR